MTITRDMPKLSAALDQESWEWLRDNLPELEEAVATEVKRGAKPVDVRLFVMRHTQRHALALRCEQAARYLAVAAEE
jgi:hypothetical protein